MKKLLFLIIIISVPALSFGQARNAGRMVVPIGYENDDSLRFYLQNMDLAKENLVGAGSDSSQNVLLLKMLDTISCTFAGTSSDPTFPLAQMKGVVSAYSDPFLWNTTVFFKQWEFSALPYPRQSGSIQSPYANRGYLWRDNDANGINDSAKVDTNWYDANDISPYSEFLTLIIGGNKFVQINSKNFCNFFKIVEGDCSFRPLDATDKIRGETNLPCKLFLRELRLQSILSEVLSEYIPNFHESKNSLYCL